MTLNHFYSFNKISVGSILSVIAFAVLATPASAEDQNTEPLMIKDQGNLFVGGETKSYTRTTMSRCSRCRSSIRFRSAASAKCQL